MALFAHSARPVDNIPAQEYGEHVGEVRRRAVLHAEEALRYRAGDAAWFRATVEWAACYHDLGKLHAANQRVLAGGVQSASLPLNHVDAGTGFLLRRRLCEAAVAVYSHHRGLANFSEELVKNTDLRPFRDEIWREVDSELEDLVRQHRDAIGQDPDQSHRPGKLTGLEWRLLLSCLVDADHTDTARHYFHHVEVDSPEPRWAERLAALDAYVAGLTNGTERSAYRSALYAACRAGDASQAFHACDSPVGSGKTTAVMAYLLRTAIEQNLRHIFVVLPYTNIVRQSVDVYRKALCLPGECAESIVGAHHHLAEFQKPESRHLTTLWRSPVIVTTAVQFFETLGAAGTARLRKLHDLPGSAVFIDEAHAAMPVHLWPFMWNQMEDLAANWGCRFVLGSGSLAKFWENKRLGKWLWEPRAIPLLAPDVLRAKGDEAEIARVKYLSRSEPLTLRELADWIEFEPGPRIVVMNTVQSAAVLARELRSRGGDVLHLSTALTPADREAIITKIQEKLKTERNGNWTLVATSCAEAGLNFDFAAGFRERCSAASLLQLGGRVNRDGLRGQCVVWDFVTQDPMLNQHPHFEASRRVVRDLFRDEVWNKIGATALMTRALEGELIEGLVPSSIKQVWDVERKHDYPKLAELTRLIQADTRLVVVSDELRGRLERRDKVDSKTLLAGSVQLWSTKIHKLALEPIPGLPDVYRWGYQYDPEFLGIMAGVLPLVEGDRDGYFLI